jgi:hypothetical protein
MKTILALLVATLLAGFVANTALAQERLHEKWRGLDAQRCPVIGCGGGEVRESGGETTTVAGELLNRLWNFFSDTSEKIAQANRDEKARALAIKFRNKVYAAQAAQRAGNDREAARLVREALALHEQADLRQWLRDYEAAVRRYEALVDAARISSRNGDMREAVRLVREALLMKEDPELRAWLGHVADWSNQQFARVYAAARETIASGNLRESIRLAKQGLAIKEDDWLRSVAVIEETINRELPELLSKAEAFQQAGNVNDAMKLLRKALYYKEDARVRQLLTNLVVALASQRKVEHDEPLTEVMDNLSEAAGPSQIYRRGFIGGTGATIQAYAYNMPSNIPPEREQQVRNTIARVFDKQLEALNIPKAEFIDRHHYDFIIGVAIHPNPAVDLFGRVVWENLAKGQATAALQKDYNKLKGRSFETLDCHSNGAMVCLAALSNRDVQVEHVRLLGPQITREALLDWQKLLDKGRIGSLEIYYNDRDPIPVLSYFGHDLVTTGKSAAVYGFAAEIFGGDGLRKEIELYAPSAKVSTFQCELSPWYVYSVGCHFAITYDRHLPAQ